jgi:hypothetical protein
VRIGSGRRGLICAGTLATVTTLSAAALAIVVVGSASGATVTAGNLIVSVNGVIGPRALPRSSYAPIRLNVDGSFKTTDGSHVPALKKVALQFDKHGTIDTEGLPTCKVSQLQSTLTAQAREVCGSALVGGGNVSAEIAFPEQAPFTASGPLLIFNGQSKGGKPVLILHVHADVPAPTTFVTTVAITRKSSGLSLVANVPTIDGGYGYISSFAFSLKRRFHFDGQEKSFLNADCPAPGGLSETIFPLAKASYEFAGGESLQSTVVSHCKVKK